MKRTLAIIFTLLAVNTARAEATMGLGFSAGFVSGFGFSFRMLPERGLGWQPSAVYIKTADLTFGSVGLQGLYIMNRSSASALYLVGGYGYHYKLTVKERKVNEGLIGERTEKYSVIYKRHAFGAGIGYTARIAGREHVCGSAELLLTSYRGDVFPYPQLAVHYFFK